MPITIGALDNVPAPGDPIRSPWAQEISGYVVHQFATTAQRDSVWVSPPNGSICVTLDTGYRWQRIAGAWVYTGGGTTPLYYATAVRLAAFSLPANAWTAIPYDTEEADPNNNFTGGLYTAPVTGTYQFHATATASMNNANQRFMVGLYLNGAEAVRGNDLIATLAGASYGLVVSGIVGLTAGNTAGIRMGNFSGGNACALDVALPSLNRFSIARLS